MEHEVEPQPQEPQPLEPQPAPEADQIPNAEQNVAAQHAEQAPVPKAVPAPPPVPLDAPEQVPNAEPNMAAPHVEQAAVPKATIEGMTNDEETSSIMRKLSGNQYQYPIRQS